LFLTRLADQLNTVFLPGNVLQEIDQLAAALEDDISYEIERWPGAGDWQASVEYMREFARRRPDYVRRQAVDYFDLPGTAVLRINDRIALQPEDLPWEGVYFQGVDVKLTAVPGEGHRFAGWESAELPQTATITPMLSDRSSRRTLSLTGDLAITPLFETADGGAPRAGDVQLARYGRDGDRVATNEPEGDWVELSVKKPGGVDLRGWRVTDNDSPAASDEGSLILGDHPALAAVPPGTSVLLVATQSADNDRRFPQDDLSPADGRMILYVGNGNLDTLIRPWFSLGPIDNLALLAPGASPDFGDDITIDFVSYGGR
jgi:hypothetical protein